MKGWPTSKGALPFRRILCLGAHSDDIEIGCGGTLLRWLGESSRLEVGWVVLSAAGEREQEARNSASAFLAGARQKTIRIEKFRDGFFPFQGTAVKEYFESLKTAFAPDLILTHYRDDAHQDHRLVSTLTWNTFRNHAIWEYEIPKFDGDLGAPNLFVGLNKKQCQRKIALLHKHFRSQRSKKWFSDDLFLALPRIRGMECQSPQDFAEAFYCRKFYV
ncbi:MAG TPA: PIG-L deacetylase family protein [Candidatus Saccharimonadales bacterium]|nr:PIG-L deacetylase family protein [Candidatus Saccharimonadales bacterium]